MPPHKSPRERTPTPNSFLRWKPDMNTCTKLQFSTANVRVPDMPCSSTSRGGDGSCFRGKCVLNSRETSKTNPSAVTDDAPLTQLPEPTNGPAPDSQLAVRYRGNGGCILEVPRPFPSTIRNDTTGRSKADMPQVRSSDVDTEGRCRKLSLLVKRIPTLVYTIVEARRLNTETICFLPASLFIPLECT